MISIRIEPPRQAEVLELLAASDAYMAGLYPAESNHLLDVAQLEASNVIFYVARIEDRAIGCGAWVRTGEAEGELKRMFVSPAARGMRLGRRLLETIETAAAEAGVRILRLETGVSQPEALALYRSAGYVERGPFGAYGPDPLSLFMEKRLTGGTGR